MFECKYKYSEEDNLIGTQYTMKQQKKKMKIFVHIAMPILLIFNIILLGIDASIGEDIVLDIILVFMVSITYAMMICTPLITKKIAKKTFDENFANKDAVNIFLDDKSCKVAFMKGNEEINKSVWEWSDLTSAVEDDSRLVLIYKSAYFVVIRKDYLQGDLDLLLILVKKFSKTPLVTIKN